MRGRPVQIISGLVCLLIVPGCGRQVAPPSPSVTSQSVASRPLAGTQWLLDASKATLSITGTQLSATNGCQELDATVAVQGSSLELTDVRLSAGPYCPQVDVPGQTVFQVLTTDSVSWNVQVNRLTVTNARGLALHYRAG